LLLLHARLEAQWFEKAVSKAYVGQPRFLEIDKEREVVEFGAVYTILASDSTREQRHPKSKGSQQGGKSSVEFVAEAAAFFIHDLVQNAAFVTDDFSPQVDIEVFERDCEEVRAVEGA
jgi:hypothetical protein